MLLITPEIGSLGVTFMIIAMTILGGIGTIPGPIIGAFIFIIATEYLRELYIYRYVIFGSLMAIAIIFMPQGIYGSIRRKLKIS